MRFLIVLALAAPSFAWEKNGDDHVRNDSSAVAGAVGIADSRSQAAAKARSESGASAVVGDTTALGGTANVDNTIGPNIATSESEGSRASVNATYRQRYQAPNVGLAPTYSSNPCWQPGRSIGASVPGAGGGYTGKGSPDEQCNVREWARIMNGTTDPVARYVLCHEPPALAVFEDAMTCYRFGVSQTASDAPDYSAMLSDQQEQIAAQEAALKRQAAILAGLTANDAKQSQLIEQKSALARKKRPVNESIVALKSYYAE